MSGNEAFARGIYEAGIRFSANYPGTPLSEVGDYLKYLSDNSEEFTFDYSLNEKIALESCIGVSWAGLRSIAMFKHLGLNVAADPLHTFPYSGVNGGMIILCGGDPGILSSTNAQDNRLYSLHTKIPIIEPGSVQECKDYIKEGLKLSEKYHIPIYVHVTTKLCHSHGIVRYQKREIPQKLSKFRKNPDRYVNTLGRALKNQKQYFNKISSLAKDSDIAYMFNTEKDWKTRDLNPPSKPKDTTIGIITSGICYNYVIEACYKLNINPPTLKLGLIFPINEKLILNFISKYQLKKILIVEELEPFLEMMIKQIVNESSKEQKGLKVYGKEFLPNVGELNSETIIRYFSNFFEIGDNFLFEELIKKEDALEELIKPLPIRQPTFCPGCQYRSVFYTLKKVTEDLKNETGVEYVFSGDIGCYTLGEAYPYELMDWVVSMGSGLGIANGMCHILKDTQRLIAFIGDSTFFHSGIQPLLNALKNDIDLTIIIFNNYWTAMTGHQELISTPKDFLKCFSDNSKTNKSSLDLIKFLKNLGIPNLTVTDAYNTEKLERIFRNTLSKDSGLRVIVINEECALEKKRRNKKMSSSKPDIYYTISDSCIKCNECIETLGCPAINAKKLEPDSEGELKYYIDESMCIPEICPGVCQSVCKNNMILKTLIQHHQK
ncbi:MAG: hypothetical protein GF317_24400 [Candidatus Lokiarchaeota archaeon]|nr:hypothetical protein [Candidatus Lokiarchaeota archaeon]MBD3202515.1 hypothetical protein [Candidatus Lokiarchaeota archaeon]